MILVYALLWLQLYVWNVLSAPNAAKIDLLMDKTSNLNPSTKMQLAKLLFKYHLLSKPSDMPATTDIVVHANWTKLVDIFDQGGVQFPRRFANSAETINLFADKAAWKKWMHSIGLGAYVPVTYNNTASPSSFEYPLVLKTNVHFGRGVHIVTSPTHLSDLVANITQRGQTYTLEEALTGMGRAEAASFGSVYQGKLASLRCLKRSFSVETAQHSVEHGVNTQHNQDSGTSVQTVSNSSLYIMGFAAKPSEQHMIPCSQELVNATQRMVQRLNYTGPFCSNIKLDKHMKPKMMEINARFCGTMAWNEPIFITTFVPFTFAALEGRYRRKELLKSANKQVFERILAAEASALKSGGGLYQGKNITVAIFSSELVLDPIPLGSYFEKV